MANLAKPQGFYYKHLCVQNSFYGWVFKAYHSKGLRLFFCCKHILLFVTSLLKAHREFQVAVLKSKTFRWCGWRQLCGFEVQINKLFSSCMCCCCVSSKTFRAKKPVYRKIYHVWPCLGYVVCFSFLFALFLVLFL